MFLCHPTSYRHFQSAKPRDNAKDLSLSEIEFLRKRVKVDDAWIDVGLMLVCVLFEEMGLSARSCRLPDETASSPLEFNEIKEMLDRPAQRTRSARDGASPAAPAPRSTNPWSLSEERVRP